MSEQVHTVGLTVWTPIHGLLLVSLLKRSMVDQTPDETGLTD